MSHVVFIEQKIICGDGERFHVGLLPDDATYAEPFVATRDSVEELLLALSFAGKVARRRSTDFSIVHEENRVELRYGAKKSIIHELEPCEVGHVPEKWREPVPATAPELAGARTPELNCDHMSAAMKWHRSWEKNIGSFTWRGDGNGGWVRLDIVSQGDHVCSAFLLPTSSVPAQLPPDEPLLAAKNGQKTGQSILDLSLDIHEKAPDTAPEPKRRRRGKAKAEEGEDAGEGAQE